jgi:hypothetical protein
LRLPASPRIPKQAISATATDAKMSRRVDSL